MLRRRFIDFPKSMYPNASWWFPVLFDDGTILNQNSVSGSIRGGSSDIVQQAFSELNDGYSLVSNLPVVLDSASEMARLDYFNTLRAKAITDEEPVEPFIIAGLADQGPPFGSIVHVIYGTGYTGPYQVEGTNYVIPEQYKNLVTNYSEGVFENDQRWDSPSEFADIYIFPKAEERHSENWGRTSPGAPRYMNLITWMGRCLILPESCYTPITLPDGTITNGLRFPRTGTLTYGICYLYYTHNFNTPQPYYVEYGYTRKTMSRQDIDTYLLPIENIITVSDEAPVKPDPFDPGGTSETGGYGGSESVEGGDGTFDWSADADDIDFNNVPSVSAVNTGFVTLLNPTETQLRDLASFMWSDLFSLDTLKKIFADPMELILGLNIVPVDVPQGSLMRLKVAGFSTGLSIYRAASQYVTVDCGSVNLQEYWGAYLDYAPYTKVNLYLPYIGVVPLNTDDVMHRTISIKYKVDILTGACMAQIKCSGGKHCNINSVMYHYTGNCAINVPVSSSNFAQTISALIGVATTAVGLYTGGSATAAAVTAGQATQAVGEAGLQVADAMLPTVPMSIARQNQAFASAEATIARGESQVASAQASRAAAVERAIGSTASYVMNAKPTINRAGSISGTSGIFGIQIPYLIIEAPRQSLAANYNTFVGYPSNINEPLSTLAGYTSFEKIFLNNIPATDPELSELYALLKNGVIF